MSTSTCQWPGCKNLAEKKSKSLNSVYFWWECSRGHTYSTGKDGDLIVPYPSFLASALRRAGEDLGMGP